MEFCAVRDIGAFRQHFCEQAFGQFDAADLILCGHLAFASLPGMEDVAVEFVHRLFVTPYLIQEGDFLEHVVVTTLYEVWIFLKECQTLGMWPLQAFVELVEFHEYALVVLVEMEASRPRPAAPAC